METKKLPPWFSPWLEPRFYCSEPSETIEKIVRNSEIILNDGDTVNLEGEFKVEIEKDYDPDNYEVTVKLFTFSVEKTKNKNYQRELEFYNREKEKFKKERKEWKELKKIYDQQQKEEKERSERKLLESLKRNMSNEPEEIAPPGDQEKAEPLITFEEALEYLDKNCSIMLKRLAEYDRNDLKL